MTKFAFTATRYKIQKLQHDTSLKKLEPNKDKYFKVSIVFQMVKLPFNLFST